MRVRPPATRAVVSFLAALVAALVLVPVRSTRAASPDGAGLALVVVVDHSGSMAGPKLAVAQRLTVAMLESLAPHDLGGVVKFDARAEVVLPLEAMRAGRELASITRVHAGGGSHVGRGLEHGLEELRTVAARARHLVLISDGQSVMTELVSMVQAADADGITVSTVAVGLGADLDAMTRLAFEGDGNFYFVGTTLASESEVTGRLRRDAARRSRRAWPIARPPDDVARRFVSAAVQGDAATLGAVVGEGVALRMGVASSGCPEAPSQPFDRVEARCVARALAPARVDAILSRDVRAMDATVRIALREPCASGASHITLELESDRGAWQVVSAVVMRCAAP